MGEPNDSWLAFQNSDYYRNQNRKDQDAVYARFGGFFKAANISQQSDAEVARVARDLLRPENNRHWGNLNMFGNANKVCANPNFRAAIMILLDEQRPIAQRLNDVTAMIAGLGKATVTPILLVAYPGKYPVWNATTEEAMRKFGIWPRSWGTFGDHYVRLADEILKWAREFGTDLWTIDHFWQFPFDGSFYDGDYRNRQPWRAELRRH